jgi:hypothetical protein
VRQFVHERQQPPSPTADEADAARPKLKFESFHFRHCYEILSSNARFIEALLTQGENGPRKRRRSEGGDDDEYSSSTSSESDTADSHEDEVLLQAPPANRFKVAKVGAISSARVPRSRALAPSAQHGAHSAIITFDDASDDLDLPRIECDRDVANEYVRLRTLTLQEDRRLKLLAELRAVVTTISQLAQQLAWNGVASAALAARTGGTCPALDEEVLRDIAFFRQEKQRLKLEIAALDANGSS